MVPVLTSFLPISRVDEYLPALFALLETFNSNIIDDRIIELLGEVAEENVSGLAGTNGALRWRDVGVWTGPQWTLLMSKCLGAMSKCIYLLQLRRTNLFRRRRCANWPDEGDSSGTRWLDLILTMCDTGAKHDRRGCGRIWRQANQETRECAS